MTPSLLIAAPNSSTRMRQAADLVVDPAAGDIATQINTKTATARGQVQFAAGDYGPKSGIIRRNGLVFLGEGEDSHIKAAKGFVGTSLFTTAPGAHYTTIRGLWLDGGNVVKHASYADSGKPDAGEPPTSPDSWHRHDDLLVTGTTDAAFASLSGQDGIREGNFRNILIIGGGFAWSGSDVFIDNVELRNSATPFTVQGGSVRIGFIKVFYSTGVGVRVASSRLMANGIEVQDAGTHGIEIAAADCSISHLKVDSCGRLASGDGVIVSGKNANLPNVVVLDRGVNALRPRNGVVINQASGLNLSAKIGTGLTGSKWTGVTTGAESIRINGQVIV